MVQCRSEKDVLSSGPFLGNYRGRISFFVYCELENGHKGDHAFTWKNKNDEEDD